MNEKFESFRKSILAGIFISIGGIVNLKVGGVVGAILFSFGLLSVIYYGLPLYTGKAGFCQNIKDLKKLPLILLGNVVGTAILGILVNNFIPEIITNAQNIVSSRITTSIPRAFFLSFLCGFIMTTVVTFARRKDQKIIPLLYGIPLFILSGFWHSIADAFYYFSAMKFSTEIFIIYLITVIGNFFGCTFYNVLVYGNFLKKSLE